MYNPQDSLIINRLRSENRDLRARMRTMQERIDHLMADNVECDAIIKELDAKLYDLRATLP